MSGTLCIQLQKVLLPSLLSEYGPMCPGNILASIWAERGGCRCRWSLLSVGHHLSPTFSHFWTHSKVRRGSACPQGAPQLHQPISWMSTRPFLEASSWSSTWQVDRPVSKIQVSHPPTYGDKLSTAVTVEERRNGLRTMRLPDLT